MTITLSSIVAFFTSTLGGQLLGAGIASMAVGQTILWLLPRPWFRKVLAVGLNTAKAPGLAAGLWIKLGPAKKLAAPVVCLLVFVGFWFFGFMDALLSKSDDDTRKIAEGLEKVLSESGSTDRRLYIQAKGMSAQQVEVVSRMAAAVAAPRETLDPVASKILDQAALIGDELSRDRLKG